MTPDERASKLAWELEHRGVSPDVTRKLKPALVATVAEAIAEEREACAKVAEEEGFGDCRSEALEYARRIRFRDCTHDWKPIPRENEYPRLVSHECTICGRTENRARGEKQ